MSSADTHLRLLGRRNGLCREAAGVERRTGRPAHRDRDGRHADVRLSEGFNLPRLKVGLPSRGRDGNAVPGLDDSPDRIVGTCVDRDRCRRQQACGHKHDVRVTVTPAPRYQATDARNAQEKRSLASPQLLCVRNAACAGLRLSSGRGPSDAALRLLRRATAGQASDENAQKDKRGSATHHLCYGRDYAWYSAAGPPSPRYLK